MGKVPKSGRAFLQTDTRCKASVAPSELSRLFAFPGLRFISANLSNAELANALRRRRTVSVCSVLKSAKRGRCAYFALKFVLMGPRCAPLETLPALRASDADHRSPAGETYRRRRLQRVINFIETSW
jgi:hypothetical protein